MRHGTGRPVRPSRTRVRTQLRPWSIISTRTRPSALSADPFSTTSPQRASPTGSPSCFTLTVAEGEAAICRPAGLLDRFRASPQPLRSSRNFSGVCRDRG